ncbi:MAG: response regulator [Thermodesulfobacteriota bacterium]
MTRILVIEDDENTRDVLRQMLNRSGYEVVEARDGKEGLKLYRMEPADLVITDILMPEKEGIQTIMELRREFPWVKIIAISGGGVVGPETYLTMARELGADRTLSKPFTLTALVALVKELL